MRFIQHKFAPDHNEFSQVDADTYSSCAHCGLWPSEHVDGACLFDSTTYRPSRYFTLHEETPLPFEWSNSLEDIKTGIPFRGWLSDTLLWVIRPRWFVPIIHETMRGRHVRHLSGRHDAQFIWHESLLVVCRSSGQFDGAVTTALKPYVVIPRNHYTVCVDVTGYGLTSNRERLMYLGILRQVRTPPSLLKDELHHARCGLFTLHPSLEGA